MAKHLTVAEFMSSSVTTVNADDKLPLIIKIMHKNRISCVIVTEQHNANSGSEDNSQRPIGIITERCIVHFIADHPDHNLAMITARALTPPTLVTIHHSDSLFEAMVLCRSQHVKHLAVVDDCEQLSGIITYSDLVDANYAQIELQAEILGNANTDDQSEINSQLLAMTLTDPMLKIGNRRSMEIDLKQTQELSIRYAQPFSIALIDIDFFKPYNDNYGHQAGDEALMATTDHLKNFIRSSDRLYRYGGEEFLLLMPDAGQEAAENVAHRLVEQISATGMPHQYSPLEKITVSIGTASFIPGKETDAMNSKNVHTDSEKFCKALIERADQALYSAKSAGRNQALTYETINLEKRAS